MDKRLLYELLDKANRDSKKTLNKEEQKSYRTVLSASLKEDGLTEENIHYITSGFKFKSTYSFMNWCYELDNEEQLKSYEELMKSRAFSGLDNVVKLRFSLTAIAISLSENNANPLIICDLFHSIVDYSLKKDGKRMSDISKIFQCYFMNELKYGAKLPTISDFHFTKEYNRKLLTLLAQSIDGIVPKGDTEITRRNMLRDWVKRNTNSADLVSEEKSVESPKVNISNEKNELKNSQVVSEKSELKNSQMVSEKSNQDIKGPLAKKILEFAMKVDVYEQNLQSMSDELKQKDKEIAKCKIQSEKTDELYKQSCNDNTELRNKLEQAMKSVIELQLKEKDLQDRVSRQSSVIDIIDEDKDRSLVEFKNQLASALKKTYEEFIVAQTMDMTVDLGLNVRDSLDDVFRKLKKQGIDIEGR